MTLRVKLLILSVLASVGAGSAQVRPVLDRYCVTCHSDRLRTAGLSLESLDTADIAAGAETWEKVIDKVRTGAMPPAGRQRPPADTSGELVSWLESELDRAAAADPDPGMPAIHRLNRTEYANTIRDLLNLEVETRELLPADDLAYGFDNIADTLSFSPVLLERYLMTARKVSSLAVGDPAIRPEVATHYAAKVMVQDERMSEDLPFGSRGGFTFRHRFPLDASYEVKIELGGRRAGEETLEVRVDGEQVAEFVVDGAPRSQGWGGAAGELSARVPIGAGDRTIGVSFLARAAVVEGLGPDRLPAANIAGAARQRSVESVEIAGPYDATGPGDTASRRRIFSCRPAADDGDEACARQILGRLARLAYRRPVAGADVDPLLDFYRQGRERAGFDAGIQRALERLLVDPEFLFRIEADPPGVAPDSAYRLSDLELASRLSFFLWSSIPDDELLAVAERGELGDPPVLERQVRRLLADRRADALVANFAAQWLHLRNVQAVAPDVNRYPEFDDNLRHAFQRETELFIGSQLREDRSVVDLLAADTTFVNERLARHYGIPGVYGSRFRRVSVGDPRVGLLGQGSVLTVTSYANRTSPVLRGKWLLENILGSPPPPPPADVPELGEGGSGEAPSSIRAQMEQHRRDPACAGCHARMDPLGFALENFDAIGRWRETEGEGQPIDASGKLPDGTSFEGPGELREVLLDQQEEFVRTFTGKLLTYALGRGVGYPDAPAVRQILRRAEPEGYTWSAIVLGIVESTPFQMRRAKS